MQADRDAQTSRPLPSNAHSISRARSVPASGAAPSVQASQAPGSSPVQGAFEAETSQKPARLQNRSAVRDRPPVVLPKVKSSEPTPRPERILVVDDEIWITEVISEQLSLEGFTVTATNHSVDVMDILEEAPYDLVILDIHMPPPNGLTLLREIRAKYPFLAVLMLTAFSDAETASMAMRDGATDYIVKPYQTAQLVSRIERALEHCQLLRERAMAQQTLKLRVDEQTRKLRAQSRQLSQMLDRVLVTYRATLKALEAALDVRDHSAPGHCRRVAKLAVQLATRLGYTGNDLVVLEHGALLHDIGKMGIPDTILLKPASLTEEEWVTMRKHPEIGCEIVGHIDFLQDALPIIRSHHEHYDGSGYPDGLVGEDIPILARIFAIADSFDAQTNQRPYNVVHSTEAALQNIIDDKNFKYDPRIVDEFVAMIREREHAQGDDPHILPSEER